MRPRIEGCRVWTSAAQVVTPPMDGPRWRVLGVGQADSSAGTALLVDFVDLLKGPRARGRTEGGSPPAVLKPGAHFNPLPFGKGDSKVHATADANEVRPEPQAAQGLAERGATLRTWQPAA